MKNLNKSVGETLQVICLSCNNKNNHKVLASVDYYYSECESMGREDEYHTWSSNFQIIECQGCESISFRHEFWDSEDGAGADNYGNELIYPERTTDTWNMSYFSDIPSKLMRVYRETILCYNNGSLVLCGAGIRALVEGLCQENNVTDGEIENPDGTKKRSDNLNGKINGLSEKGILTKELAEILHQHRFLGNTAVHNLEPPTKKGLGQAIKIIEHILDSLYEIPETGTQLERELERELKRGKNKSKP